MTDEHNLSQPASLLESVCVSLVSGDPNVRHARQLMLRSENADVRSYATFAALLADPRSRDCACIVLDAGLDARVGPTLLCEMRATGWRGKAIILDGSDPAAGLLQDVEQHGDKILDHAIGDSSLVAAIAATVDRSWSGWNARG